MKSLLIALLACLTYSQVFSQKVVKIESDSTNKLNNAEFDDYLRRSAARTLILIAAEKIANNSGDAEAKAAVEFLQKEQALGIIGTNQWKFAEKSVNTSIVHRVAIAIIYPEDLPNYFALNPESSLSNCLCFCFAWPPNQAVICFRQDQKLSEFTTGLLMLHEGLHAQTHVKNGVTNRESALLEEVRVREFDRRIMKKLGGKYYEKAIVEYMVYQLKKITEKNLGVGNFFADSPHYSKELDVAFGAALSEADRMTRRTSANIDAAFRLLEKYYQGEDMVEKKSAYIKSLNNSESKEYVNSAR